MTKKKNGAPADKPEQDLVRPLPSFGKQYGEPCVLVLKEKHNTSYYLVQDEAHLHAVALEIVRQRFEDAYANCYGSTNQVAQNRKNRAEKVAQYTSLKQQIAGLTNEWVVAAGQEALGVLVHEIRACDEFIRHHVMAKRAVAEQNGLLAWMLLEERSEHEYERVSIETLGDVKTRCPRPQLPFHGQCWTDEHGDRWTYDERTLQRWIPRIYAQIYYNVQKFQGIDPIVRQLY